MWGLGIDKDSWSWNCSIDIGLKRCLVDIDGKKM